MGQPHLIRPLLRSALQLWLRSLVSQAERLEITIDASDRQLLRGQVPEVMLRVERAVYQGLYLHELSLQAADIRLNLGQILRGKPARLLAPVPAQLQTYVTEADLNQSLGSDLLASALATATQHLLPNRQFSVGQVTLSPGQIHLQGQLSGGKQPQTPGPACLSAHLVSQGAVLQANQVTLAQPGAPPPINLPDQAFPLGDATLQQLDITAEAIALRAQIKILP
ncbi:MAG: DUF2993 domain-containing protein [Cyanobacteria bacterium P01_A01_bin.135]